MKIVDDRFGLLSIPGDHISMYGGLDLKHSVHCFVSLVPALEYGFVGANLLFRNRQQEDDVVVKLRLPEDSAAGNLHFDDELEKLSNKLAGAAKLEIVENKRRVYCNLTWNGFSISGSCDRDDLRKFLVVHRERANAA